MGAIKCYGDFWSRSAVNWNPGPAGRALWGRRRRPASEKINLKDQIGVYVLFTPQREIVYVGQVGLGERGSLFGRLRRHNYNRLRARWTHFSWFGIREITDDYQLEAYKEQTVRKKSALNEIEAVLIHLLEPRLNRQGPQWEGATEFVQWAKDDPADVETDQD